MFTPSTVDGRARSDGALFRPRVMNKLQRRPTRLEHPAATSTRPHGGYQRGAWAGCFSLLVSPAADSYWADCLRYMCSVEQRSDYRTSKANGQRSTTSMVPALACPRLVLALVLVLAVLHSAEGNCSGSQIECRKNGQCIYKYNLCDGTRHCTDGSDEDRTTCEGWPSRTGHCDSRRYPTSPIYYSGGCYSVYDMCTDTTRSQHINSRVCEIVLKNKLGQEGMNMTIEVVSLLSSAVNSTLEPKKPDCPMLYTRVGSECLSFFVFAKVSWPEARHFCRSIYGDLWHFTDLTSYGQLMAYMREEQFTSNFWIGGRFDLDTNAWSWTTDDSAMPLGAPYWTLQQESSCVRRGPPHTDPFSDPPAALPNAPCFKNVLSPKKRAVGWCAATTYENYYFWSDEECEEKFSPLCIFIGPSTRQEANSN